MTLSDPALASSFAPVSDHHQRAIEPDGVRHGARLVPYDEGEDLEPWPVDHYEYLVANPWLVLPDMRPVHICTRHPGQQLRDGHFPSDFQCPNQVADCPWKRLVAEHGALRLRGG